MGSLKSFHEHLRNSRSQARKLTEIVPALNELFATEGIRLEREDEVSILRVTHRAIVEQSRRVKEIEASLSCGHSQMNAILFLTELTVTAMVSKGNRMSATKDYLLRKASDRKQPFGLAMVCIAPRGLPDDARVVSISQSARESNRTEPEIVNKLQDQGYLIFSEEAFSFLVERLVGDIREGKLCLPVSREKLANIAGLNKPKSRIKIVPIE